MLDIPLFVLLGAGFGAAYCATYYDVNTITSFLGLSTAAAAESTYTSTSVSAGDILIIEEASRNIDVVSMDKQPLWLQRVR